MSAFRLLARPWVILALLVPVYYAYTSTEIWGGEEDCWETAAAIRAVSNDPFQPSNPMLTLPGNTSPRFTPYTIAWGWVMRVLNCDILTVMKVSAFVNLLIVFSGIWRFARTLHESTIFPVVLLCVLFFVWGTGYAQSNAYHFWFFFYSLPHVSLPSFGLALHALADLRGSNARQTAAVVTRYVILVVLAFLIHPVSGVFAVVCGIAYYLHRPNVRILALHFGAGLAVVLALAVWPFFDYLRLILDGTADRWYSPVMYQDQIPALGAALLGVPVAVFFAIQRRHGFVVVSLFMFSLLYFTSWALDIRIGERFILFAAIFMHAALALFFIETAELWSRLSRPLSCLELRLRLFVVLLVLLLTLPFRSQDIRMTGSLLISSTVYRRHEETYPEKFASLRGKLDSRSVLLTDAKLGWTLPALTGTRVVYHIHGNPLLTRELETRLADTRAFLLGSATEQERSRILALYGVTHVLLNLREPSTFSPDLPAYLACVGTRVGEQNDLALYRVQT